MFQSNNPVFGKLEVGEKKKQFLVNCFACLLRRSSSDKLKENPHD